MAEKYCAFLRGINVNGINIKMDALKKAFISMGYHDVKTILATGNVIFTLAEKNRSLLENRSYIERELSNFFKYDAHVIIRSSSKIQDIYSASQTIDVPEECHNYYLFCDDTELPMELKQLFDSMPNAPQERLTILKSGIFWVVPKGSTLSSDFGSKVLGSKKYKSRLTSRNINTIQKIAAAMICWNIS